MKTFALVLVSLIGFGCSRSPTSDTVKNWSRQIETCELAGGEPNSSSDLNFFIMNYNAPNFGFVCLYGETK